MSEEKEIKSCVDCHYSGNGVHACNRLMDYATPKIDLSKGAECAYNGFVHYLKFQGKDEGKDNKVKKEFTAPNGHKGMLIDCGVYEIEIFKNLDKSSGNCIKYTEKITGTSVITPYAFLIDWDEEKDGGKLTIRNRDRWGSEMLFIHYEPSDLKGMFDFIGKGYHIFDKFKM